MFTCAWQNNLARKHCTKNQQAIYKIILFFCFAISLTVNSSKSVYLRKCLTTTPTSSSDGENSRTSGQISH